MDRNEIVNLATELAELIQEVETLAKSETLSKSSLADIHARISNTGRKLLAGVGQAGTHAGLPAVGAGPVAGVDKRFTPKGGPIDAGHELYPGVVANSPIDTKTKEAALEHHFFQAQPQNKPAPRPAPAAGFQKPRPYGTLPYSGGHAARALKAEVKEQDPKQEHNKPIGGHGIKPRSTADLQLKIKPVHTPNHAGRFDPGQKQRG
jgi:hypothetical protein